MESELSNIFQVKLGSQNSSALVPGDPAPSCLYNLMPLSEETCKCSKPDRWP